MLKEWTIPITFPKPLEEQDIEDMFRHLLVTSMHCYKIEYSTRTIKKMGDLGKGFSSIEQIPSKIRSYSIKGSFLGTKSVPFRCETFEDMKYHKLEIVVLDDSDLPFHKTNP